MSPINFKDNGHIDTIPPFCGLELTKRWTNQQLYDYMLPLWGHHHIIIRFLINVQVQGHHPHQWAPSR